MCRSIKTLRVRDVHASDDEIAAAARQYIRKVSGFHHPSRRNESVFEEAVKEVADATRRMLDNLQVAAGPKPSSLQGGP